MPWPGKCYLMVSIFLAPCPHSVEECALSRPRAPSFGASERDEINLEVHRGPYVEDGSLNGVSSPRPHL